MEEDLNVNADRTGDDLIKRIFGHIGLDDSNSDDSQGSSEGDPNDDDDASKKNRRSIVAQDESDESSPLHSLEDASKHGATVQRYISKYLDTNLDSQLLSRSGKKQKEKENLSRTIKAVSSQLSNETLGKKHGSLRRELSLSTGSLPSLFPPVSPSSTPATPTSPTPTSPGFFLTTTGSVPIMADLTTQGEMGKRQEFSDVQHSKSELRRRKRTSHISRHMERDLKKGNMQGDFLHSVSPEVHRAVEKFSCVSCPKYSTPHGHRSPSLSVYPDCPLERVQFYRTFSVLVRMGSKERQLQDKQYTRMDSVEKQLYQKDLKDLLWLELMSWHGGMSMVEQDKLLYERRRSIPLVLQELLHFCVPDRLQKCCKTQDKKVGLIASPHDGVTAKNLVPPSEQCKKTSFRKISSDLKTIQSIVELLEKSSSSDVSFAPGGTQPEVARSSIVEESCDCSETFSRVCQECINRETLVLEQVTAILEKLDQIEHLYPCTKSLGVDHPVYNCPEAVARMKTLNLWFNITVAVRQKINLLVKLFGFKNRSEIGWPSYKDEKLKEEKVNKSKGTLAIDSGKPKTQTSLKILNFKVSTSGVDSSSPTTSGSDGRSVPVSPDVHQISHGPSPFDTPNSSTSSGYHSSQQILRLCSVLSATNSATHIYRKYVDKALKQKGLRHIYIQLSGILKPVLIWIHATLKRRIPISTYAEAAASHAEHSSIDERKPSDVHSKFEVYNKDNYEELACHGMWSEIFQNIGLPTFHRPFFFLMRVPLDVVHECLRLRIEQQPEEPSALSIRQLIKECKEVLRAAVQMRQQYVSLAQTVLGEGGSDVIEAQLDLFDEDLKTMLQVYLRYLEQLMLIMQKVSPVCSQQKSYLEEEWVFVRANCPHIPGGEALAVHKFCFMASDLLGSIGHRLETGIDECIAILYESSANEHGSTSYRKGIQDACRRFKNIFYMSSERARQAIAFAKTLRKDLEIATEFNILVPTETLLQKLRETEHILVIAPHSSSYLMFVPGHLQNNITYIWQLVDMTCGHESNDIAQDHDGYLIMMSCDTCTKMLPSWGGPALVLEPTAEATITLSHVEVDGLLLVVNHSSQLMSQCRKFQRVMGNTLEVDKQQTSCNHAIAEALNELKSEALELREKITRSISQVEEKFDTDVLPDLDEIERVSLQKRCREILHQGYQFGFEYQKAVTRLITGEARARMGKGLISFALQWMKFVSERCEQGRGRRPRWANQGLEFLITACDPQNLQSLNDEEFQVLKQSMNDCISHLIGSPDKSSTSRVTSPTQMNLSPGRLSFSSRSYSTASSRTDASSTPPTPPAVGSDDSGGTRRRSEDDPFNFDNRIPSYSTSETTPIENVRKSIWEIEEKYQKKLEKKSVIGHVSDVAVPPVYLHISARRVNFPWQRGFKIGEGRFGKVYTAVNNTTGELIAMKEIRLQPNDHRAIKEAMDEIRIFEGIKHPNLVRYYGVEIHREEMLIFMEYCNEGSLESAAQLCLPESLVRKYTRQLLAAVNVLHEHGIVHRDIKSANIFLMSDGSLKLGDFGCCIKLKNQTTMAGELHGFVGTPAYMAPEVFTKTVTEGHGRAADIWSVGCVVLEMAAGQRPWHDLENSFQIMFRVGMGEVPKVPCTLSVEGQDFLGHCLLSNSRQRWTASQLLDHPFTKVHEEED